MATYAYTVRDAAGTMRNGTSEAENPDVLARRLREQGFVISEIKAAKAKKAGGNWFENLQKIKLTELSIFCRQFSTMIDAGVSLVRCLDVLSQQQSNPRFKRIILDVLKEVEAGQTLSKSMAKYPSVFSNLFIGLVRAGEVGGVLEETLQRLSTFLEKDVEMKRKIKSAMTYPSIVMGAAVLIVTGLCRFIVPTFLGLFETMLPHGRADFPALTLGLVAVSDFLTYKLWAVILIVTASNIAFKAFIKTNFGMHAWDKFKLKVPVFGKLNHKVALARFSRTLGTLLTSGVPILQALETVAGTVSNVVISDAIMEARARIREGDRIGDPLIKSKLFPPMVVQMISIGEESGSLDAMLAKIADFYEDEVDAALAALAVAIEPMLICFLGVAVLLIILGMFMPMIVLIQSLSGGDGTEKGASE
jgi:type IV pilus assembly protein PilC